MNCIRLKKECSFYPVDQQQIPEYQRTKQPPQRSSTGGKISASSSPALPSGQPNDYAHMPPIMAPPATKPSGDRYSPDSKGKSILTSLDAAAQCVDASLTEPSTARGYDYAPPTANTNWMSSDASPSSSKPGELNATWRSYPPESPAFSPYTPHAPPHSATWATPSDSGSREDMWQSSYPPPPPTRTMSQGGESMSSYGQYPAPPHGSSGRPYDRKSASMSEMYPPPIVTSAMDGSATSAVDPHGSLSAGAVPPPTYGSWQPPYSYSSKPGESPYGSSGWYGENSTSSHVGSEEPTSAADATAPSSSIYYGSR